MGSRIHTKYQYTELLAPAGSPDAFYGAINAGADAVYLAGNRFGARAYAENFSTEKLVECIQYAHLMGRKLYLTVNTLLKESELAELYDYLVPFYEAGLDAVIVQDLGVFRYIREHFPGLELHVSTQMTICNHYDAALLRRMGASRIVPARELSLQELTNMKQRANVEIETFIHGAMCYCYSGQCLFSSILGGRSGNRGRCAQPCRLPYTVQAGKTLKENCYPLSLKDMCTIEAIPQLIEAGIDSFKIEGRMKRPEYAAGVTDVYRRAMDCYYDLREKKGVEEAMACYKVPRNDMSTLRTLYIRSDVQDGYYFRHNGAEMVTMTSPAYSGNDEALLQKINNQFLSSLLKVPVAMKAEFQVNHPALVTFICRGIEITVTGDIVSPAMKQPITEENVRKQLAKLGESFFAAEKIEIGLSENAFYPLKQINELRRIATEKLKQALLAEYTSKTNGAILNAQETAIPDDIQATAEEQIKHLETKCIPARKRDTGYVVSLSSLEQLNTFVEWYAQHKDNFTEESFISRILLEGDMLLDSGELVYEIGKKLAASVEIWIALPYIFRGVAEAPVKELLQIHDNCTWISGFLARSLGEVAFLQEETDRQCRIRGDVGLYTWNHSAMEELSALVEGFCLPYELRAGEQKELLGTYPCEKIIYGRIPMMITANCLLRTVDKCKKNSSEATILTDRYHTNFKVVRNCRYCYNIIYNSVPLSLCAKQEEWKKTGVDLRMDFTYESGAEMWEIMDAILFHNTFPFKNYTTGHEKRGVE